MDEQWFDWNSPRVYRSIFSLLCVCIFIRLEFYFWEIYRTKMIFEGSMECERIGKVGRRVPTLGAVAAEHGGSEHRTCALNVGGRQRGDGRVGNRKRKTIPPPNKLQQNNGGQW